MSWRRIRRDLEVLASFRDAKRNAIFGYHQHLHSQHTVEIFLSKYYM
jgi:hypothetical protein